MEVGRALGAKVIAAASTREKRKLALAHGAHVGIDYTQDDWLETVRQVAGGEGVDIVFDPVGGHIGEQSLRCMRWGGRLLVVGFASGSVPRISGHELLLNQLQAIGVYWSHDRDSEMIHRVVDRLQDLLSEGALRPHLDQTYSLTELPQALNSLVDRKSNEIRTEH